MATGKSNVGTKKKAKSPKMRVSQGAIAKQAIHNITLLYRKMGLNPSSEKSAKSRLLAIAGVPAKLIEQVAAAADQNGSLAGMTFDSDGAREALAYAAAFEPVAIEAEAFAQRVRDSIIIAKSNAGASALAVYAAMRGYVRSPEGADLRGSFDRMTQIMKERRNVGKRGLNKKIATAVANAKASSIADATAAAASTSSHAATPAGQGTTTKGATTVVVNTPGGGVA